MIRRSQPRTSITSYHGWVDRVEKTVTFLTCPALRQARRRKWPLSVTARLEPGGLLGAAADPRPEILPAGADARSGLWGFLPAVPAPVGGGHWELSAEVLIPTRCRLPRRVSNRPGCARDRGPSTDGPAGLN